MTIRSQLMKNMIRLTAVLAFAAMLLPNLLLAQTAPARPFHDGPVWDITFVKAKPGLGLNYMVIQTESHSPNDFDLMLMTEFKDLATMEANQDKAEAVANQALSSNDQKMIAGYQERASWREIIGDRLAREIILEPKK